MRLAEFLAGFAPDPELRAGRGIDIALIRRIHKDFCPQRATLSGCPVPDLHADDTAILDIGLFEFMELQHSQRPLPGHKTLKDFFRHRRFVIISVTAGFCGLGGFSSAGRLVMGFDAVRELAEEPLDGRGVSDVAFAQPAGGHPPEMGMIFHQHDRVAEPRSRHRRGNATRRSADHHHIAGIAGIRGLRPVGMEEDRQEHENHRCQEAIHRVFRTGSSS